MICNEEKEVILLREIIVAEPYQYKEKTKERGQVCQNIADNLNNLETPTFSVAALAVRERFKLL